MKVRVEKKRAKQTKVKPNTSHLLLRHTCTMLVNVDEKETQPVVWTERPTSALVGAGSFWPVLISK
jgi:hypothetical protein